MSAKQCEKTAETKTAQIRYMVPTDLAQVMDIERKSFDNPWDETAFCTVLTQKDYVGQVTDVDDKQVAGFIVYRLRKARLHIVNIAVDPAFRRCKVGTHLVKAVIRKLRAQHHTSVTIDVAEPNLPMQLFLRALGFKWVKTTPAFYVLGGGAKVDAYRFAWQLPVEPATV